MANHKKTLTYWFDDGMVQIPSSYEATCTKTGAKVKFYHKVLVKLIESKYKNRFKLFESTYVCADSIKEEKSTNDADPNRLNIYSQYLVICYKEAISKNDSYTAFLCEERFEKHFKQNIKDFLNDSVATNKTIV